MEAGGRITTSRPFCFNLGMRAPRLLSRHPRSHGITSRVAIGEDEALKGKGWLR
jgi:hypothetical protein